MSKNSRKPTADDPGSLFRRIPSVERILSRDDVRALESSHGRSAVATAARAEVDALRASITADSDASTLDDTIDSLGASIARRLRRELRASLGPVINATGIVVHTNLGRAPLSERAVQAVAEVARGYSNLELDLESGKRGSRHRHAAHLLERLFPGHDALVVNNAAAALMLSLNTFALGKEVIISRGELVEIGGSFRVPDIMERSGARLREVGTTNKSRIGDYESAIGPDASALLRVHPSNFRIVGFTESATTEEMVRLGREHNLVVIEDFGSGNLVPLEKYGLPGEPTVSESLAAGVHLSIFSGDKLLGGPQAGILVGTPEAVAACRKNPMARALRVDKLTYAALEATLLSFVEEKAETEVPVLRMVSLGVDEIRARARALVSSLGPLPGVSLTVEDEVSRVGGGAAPDAALPSAVLSVAKEGVSPDSLLRSLRRRRPPILARISDGRVLFDLRTVAEDEDSHLKAALLDLANR